MTAAGSNLTVVYDASSRSYTVSTANRSQTFTPADVDSVQSSATLQVFKKTTGSLTESLSLTKPGTSGKLTYEYVGGGYWQRALNNGTTIDASFDAFTYGVETPDAALPRTGTGVYAVDLIGAMTDGVPYSLAGSGVFQADFRNGQITTTGRLQKLRSDDGARMGEFDFFGNGMLSSSANAFTGTFGFNDFGLLSGTMQGRFYGPAAQEVGAAWNAQGSDGRVAVGTITGRKDPTNPGINQTLLDLRVSETFNVSSANIGYNRSPDGKVGPNGGTGPDLPRSSMNPSTFAFDAATGRFTYQLGSNSSVTFAPENKVAAQSDARVTVYELPVASGRTQRLVLYNPGAGNTELALTYVSFGRFQSSGPQYSINTSTPTGETLFAWGLRTNPNTLPRTGTGRFEGLVFGTAAGQAIGAAIYDLSGTSVFDVDFARSTFAGSLALLGRDAAGGTRDFGAFPLLNGVISGNPVLRADVANGSNTRVGGFEGAFYGPGAAELGGSFWMTIPGAGSDPAFSVAGVTIAKRKP